MAVNNRGVKIIVFIIVGTAIMHGVYLFYTMVREENPRDTYTEADIKRYYETCYLTSKVTKYYPAISKANCECITNEITNKYTKQDLEKLDGLAAEERNKILMDIFIKCGRLSGRDTVRVLNRP